MMSKRPGVSGENQRLAHDHAAGFTREELVDRLAVDDDVAGARLDEHTSDRSLAAAGTVVVVTAIYRLLQISRTAAAERYADATDPRSTSASSAWRSPAGPGSMPLHRLLEHTLGKRCWSLGEVGFVDTARQSE